MRTNGERGSGGSWVHTGHGRATMSGAALTRRAPSDESNEELCARFQKGDRGALGVIVKQNSGLVDGAADVQGAVRWDVGPPGRAAGAYTFRLP